MIKCDYCDDIIDDISSVTTVELSTWGQPDNIDNIKVKGQFHEKCSLKIIKKGNKFCDKLKMEGKK